MTDINLRKAKSYSSIKNEYRVKNLLYLKYPIGQKIYKKDFLLNNCLVF